MSSLKVTIRQDVLNLLGEVCTDLTKEGVAQPLEVLATLVAAFYLLAPDPHGAKQLLEEIAPQVWAAMEAEVMKGEVEH